MQQIHDPMSKQPPSIFRLAFRPFFLFGSIYCVIALFLWASQFFHDIGFNPYGGGYWWHSHEMVFGFSTAIITGFLLTAVQNWTGIPGIKGNKLIFLVVLWLIPRILMFVPSMVPDYIIIVSDLLLLPAVALVLATPVVKIKQWRNILFVPILLVFTIQNGLFHWGIVSENLMLSRNAIWSSVFTIVLLISIIGSRVIPFFTARGTGTEPMSKILSLEIVANAVILVLVFYYMFGKPAVISTLLIQTVLFIGVLAQLIRWFHWRIWVCGKVPLLWSLHLSYLFIPIGLTLLLLNSLGISVSESQALHSFTVGSIGGMVLAMIARVSLGHTGRMLETLPMMKWAFGLMIVAGLIRSPLLTLNFLSITWSLTISFALFIIAYLIFISKYFGILTSPRVDGRPG